MFETHRILVLIFQPFFYIFPFFFFNFITYISMAPLITETMTILGALTLDIVFFFYSAQELNDFVVEIRGIFEL